MEQSIIIVTLSCHLQFK